MPHVGDVTRMHAVAPEHRHVTPDRLRRGGRRGGAVAAAIRFFGVNWGQVWAKVPERT